MLKEAEKKARDMPGKHRRSASRHLKTNHTATTVSVS